MKYLRIILYILALALSIRFGRVVYTTVFQLISFQIEIYAYVLQGQEFINNTSAKAQGVLNDMVGFFSENNGSEKIGKTVDYDQRLESFTALLKKIARRTGIILGAISYYFITKIIFGIRSHLQKIQSFIK